MSHPGRTAMMMIAMTLAPFSSAFALDCANQGSTAGMVECAGQDLAQEDARLNYLYQHLMAPNVLDDTGKGLLKAAQRQWVKFRDADCEWAADQMRGGTGAAVLRIGCLADHTKRRADALESELSAR